MNEHSVFKGSEKGQGRFTGAGAFLASAPWPTLQNHFLPRHFKGSSTSWQAVLPVILAGRHALCFLPITSLGGKQERLGSLS